MSNASNRPSVIGGYRLHEPLGAGGMGTVYRATGQDGQAVALKLLHEQFASQASYLERFRREAAVAALLESPAVVRVLEFASDRGRPYIVTELVDGPSVEQLLQRGALGSDRAVSIARDVALALAEAERRSIVHRDIKPANILVAPDGRAKVTDFGIASTAQASVLTMPGLFIGTAAYAAPEQHRGEADTRSDIYALGVVLFEMLAGRLPYQAATATGLMRQHEEQPFPADLLGGTRPDLVAVVRRCMEKRPEDRFAHAADVASALDGLEAARATVVGVPVALSATVGLADADPGSTVVQTGAQANSALAPAVVPDPAATALGPGLRLTDGSAISAESAAAGRYHDMLATGGVRKVIGGAFAVAAITLALAFSFSHGHSEQPPMLASGGSGGIVIEAPPASPTTQPSTTPIATLTAEPTEPTKTPPVKPTRTPTPTPTFTSTNTPPPATPTPRTQTPAPIPALAIADYAFCHADGCVNGNQQLYVGYTIGVAFQLSGPTSLAVSAEVWFNGVYYYRSDFTPSSNGAYFDVLPSANEPGVIELRISAGGSQVGVIRARVS